MPAVMTVRAVCIKVTCCSSDRTPRTFVDITDPIATMQTATTASAINTSMIVKPDCGPSIRGGAVRDNFDPSGQPVDANLIASIEPGQRDGPAARHSVGKEADGRERRPLAAALRQQRVKLNIVGNTDRLRGRAGTGRACSGGHECGDLSLARDRPVAAPLQRRCASK